MRKLSSGSKNVEYYIYIPKLLLVVQIGLQGAGDQSLYNAII